jgi:5-methylcytosine-specific restriction endonuclease McrA
MKLSDDFEIDHIIAKCYNGPHELYNLQTLCINCHKIKTDTIDRELSKTMDKLKHLSNEDKIIKIKLKMKEINLEIKSIIN